MKLIEYMPPFLKDVREFNEIFKVEDAEINKLKDGIEKLLNEVIVKTADSYGLERYEKIYHIKNVAQTLEARRMTILLKMNNRTNYTYKWLIGTLNEAIGKDNYKITTDFNNYKMHIEIALNYTEAAEILRKDLVKQIPANIELDYRLISKIDYNTGAIVCQKNYIHLCANADTIKENIELIQNNNIAVNVRSQEYLDLESNKEPILQTEQVTCNSNIGSKMSQQNYIKIKECEK